MEGVVIYLIEALAAAAVGAVLLVRSRKGDISRRGVIACLVSVAWGLILAGQASVGVHVSWVALIVEALRYGAWFVLLRSLAPSPAWFKRTFLGVVLGLVTYAVIGWIGDYAGLYSIPLAGVLETFGLLLTIGGLVATEQTMRNASAENSKHVRLCAIGVGGQLTFDLFLFSQAQLLGAVD